MPHLHHSCSICLISTPVWTLWSTPCFTAGLGKLWSSSSLFRSCSLAPLVPTYCRYTGMILFSKMFSGSERFHQSIISFSVSHESYSLLYFACIYDLRILRLRFCAFSIEKLSGVLLKNTQIKCICIWTQWPLQITEGLVCYCLSINIKYVCLWCKMLGPLYRHQ